MLADLYFILFLFSGKEKFKWLLAAARYAISLRLEKEKEFKSCKSHETVWRSIAAQVVEAFASSNFTVTWEQCANKYKQAKREWRSAIDNNNRTGQEPKSTPFDDQFDEAFGNKPATRPSYTLHVGSMESHDIDTDSSFSTTSASSIPASTEDGDGEKKKCEKKKRKIGAQKPQSTVTWLTEFEERQSKRREIEMEKQEKMHNEKCELFKQFLSVLANK